MKMFKLFNKDKNLKILKIINKKNFILRFFIMLIGIFLIAFSFNVFIVPSKLVNGGVGGLAVLVNYLTNINISQFIFFVNIFLIGLSILFLDKSTSITNIIGSLFFTLFIFLTENINEFVNVNFDNILLYVLCAAVVQGIGAGLVFRAGFSSGGSDILSLILNKYLKISVGKSSLIINSIIVLLGGAVFGFTNVIYAIIINYISTLIIDKILIGISESKMFMITTDKEDEIKSYIMDVIKSGVTVLDAVGGYSDDKNDVLMCIVPTSKYFLLKESIKEIDNNAFIIVSDCYEVYGGTSRKIIPF